jgi:hypothetical protein
MNHAPALEHTPSGYRCGMMTRPLHYVARLRRHGGTRLAAAARLILGAGLGCNQRYTDEANPAFDQRLAAYQVEHATELRKARRIWGLA